MGCGTRNLAEVVTIKRPKCFSLLLSGLILLATSLLLACYQPTPRIALSPATFSFTAYKARSAPQNDTLNISNSGGGALNWVVSTDAEWLNLQPTNGTSMAGEVAQVKLTVDTSNLTTNNYSGIITISSLGASNSPQMVQVSLSVSPYSEKHEESFSLYPSEGCRDYREVTFTIEEHEKIQLSWFAYGKEPYVYVTLKRPDGTYYAGSIISLSGPIDQFSPTDYPLFGLFGGRSGSTGELNFYCSNAYDEYSRTTLYPPGSYILYFAICPVNTPASDVNVKLQYSIYSLS